MEPAPLAVVQQGMSAPGWGLRQPAGIHKGSGCAIPPLPWGLLLPGLLLSSVWVTHIPAAVTPSLGDPACAGWHRYTTLHSLLPARYNRHYFYSLSG